MLQYLLGLSQLLLKETMSYTVVKFMVLVFVAALLYYILPRKIRWTVLLLASGVFYYDISTDINQLIVFAASVLFSYGCGIGIEKASEKGNKIIGRLLLALGIIVSSLPLLYLKCGLFIIDSVLNNSFHSWIVPVGLSFYTMQIIAYLSDICRAKIKAQKNPLKYALFVSFFPIIIQGPISRYDQLGPQLFEGHSYDYDSIVSSLELVLWGFFLKYAIADTAAVIVNAVFDGYEYYTGLYIFIAGVLYSIQLYTDFLSCVTISRGVAGIFGIKLIDNFNHPYFSTSIKDFWRRWHISLSHWLRDYIYIPLGGSRKGKLRKYINLFITFAVSGIWHGGRWKFLLWGLMHAGYHVTGDLLAKPKDTLLEKLSLPHGSKTRRVIETLFTCFLVMLAWIIFRAESMKIGIKLIISMFTTLNPWILTDGSLLRLGLGLNNLLVFFISLFIFFVVSLLQERGMKIRDWLIGRISYCAGLSYSA